MKRYRIIGLAVIAVAIVLGIALFFPFPGKLSDVENAISKKYAKEARGLEDLHFDLVDPGQAPQQIRDLVQLGYHIMLSTPESIDQYKGARISCTNCHFAGGNTTGGKNGGISLVGVAAVYPKYNSRTNTVDTLAERINNCFERSLNSNPIPLDSKEMKALLAYMQWISHGIGIYTAVPWLGLPKLESTHIPDRVAGQKVYAAYCAMCHGKEGRGEVHAEIPPLWGPDSFNTLAGMNVESTLASFTYYNMPYTDAGLTIEQALDVAAFIAQQPRPEYDPLSGSNPSPRPKR